MITKCGFQIETYITESKNVDPNLKSMNVDFRKELQVIVPLQSVPEETYQLAIFFLISEKDNIFKKN